MKLLELTITECPFVHFPKLRFMNSSKIYLILVILFVSFMLKAQQNFKDEKLLQLLIGETYVDKSFNYKGIHFKDAFQSGKITLFSNDSLRGLKLRYNSLEDEVIWLSENYGQVKLDKEIIKSFELFSHDTVFHFRQMKLPGDTLSHFYQIMHEGKMKFYIKRKVKHRTDYYRRKIHYFVYKPNPQYHLLVNNRHVHLKKADLKSLETTFQEFQDDIHEKARQLDYRNKKEEDFISLITSLEDIFTSKN